MQMDDMNESTIVKVEDLRRAQHLLSHLPLDIKPDHKSEPEQSVFQAQIPYIKSRILRSEENILEALETENPDLIRGAIVRAGLMRPDLISLATLSQCLAELQVKREMMSLIYRGYPKSEVSEEFDPHVQLVEEQAEELELIVVAPKTRRGTYMGDCVALDFRSCLIRFCINKAIVLPFWALGKGQPRPIIGDRLQMKFCNRELTVTYANPRT